MGFVIVTTKSKNACDNPPKLVGELEQLFEIVWHDKYYDIAVEMEGVIE
jgi:hypothetical protein